MELEWFLYRVTNLSRCIHGCERTRNVRMFFRDYCRKVLPSVECNEDVVRARIVEVESVSDAVVDEVSYSKGIGTLVTLLLSVPIRFHKLDIG